MISCKKATEIISKSFEEPLSASEKISLWVHLYICEFCEQFKKQLEIIRNSLRGVDSEPEASKKCPVLSDEAKQRIKELLRKK